MKADPLASKCIRCDTCDGYPCLVHAKSDADINCIRQIMHLPNVTLITKAPAPRACMTNSHRHGRSPALRSIHSDSDSTTFASAMTAGLFARLRRRRQLGRRFFCASANEKHPTGLANRSDQVGRNFMYHQADALLAL